VKKVLMVFMLVLVSLASFAQPSNDHCDSAQVINDWGCWDGHNIDAMDDIESCPGCHVPNCGRHDEVWFSFQATSTTQFYSLASTDLSYIEILLFTNCDTDTLIHDNCGSTTLDGVFTGLTVGDTYYIAISSDDNNQGVFSICLGTALPIELLYFDGEAEDNINKLYWETASQMNNDYFTIEHSTNGEDYEVITHISGEGTTTERVYYEYLVYNFEPTVNYYRLSQTDYDGRMEVFNIVGIDNKPKFVKLVKVINMIGAEVSQDYNGIKIYVYEDGTIMRKF